MTKKNKKSYESPFSVARRNTVFLDSKDPRADGSKSNIDGTISLGTKAEQYRSNIGSDVIIKSSEDPFALQDYIFQCISDSLQISVFRASPIILSETIQLDGTIHGVDNVSNMELFPLLPVDIAESILISNKTNEYTDDVSTYVPSQLYEISLSDIQYPTTSIATDTDPSTTLGTVVIATATVSYDRNGAVGSAPVDVNVYYNGDIATILGQSTMERDGYVFSGWNTNQYGTGTTYQEGDTLVTGYDAIILYAMWTNVYTITYNGNGNDEGVVPIDNILYYSGNIATVLGQGTLVKYGKTFDGWNTSQYGGGITYQYGDSFTISNTNIILYALWI